MRDKCFNKVNTFCLILLCLSLSDLIAQRGDCYNFDTTNIKRAPFIKKDYMLFQKDFCDTKNYNDSKVAKELFCRAKYYFSINNFIYSIHLLKQAYIKGSSKMFKFQILKLVAENYRLLGDINTAKLYDAKVNKVLQNNPELDKDR